MKSHLNILPNMKTLYPAARPDFQCELEAAPCFVGEIERIMQRILPPHFFEGEDILSRLMEQLPIICWTPLKEPPFDLSIFMWCNFRPHAFRFFYEMVSNWLIPGRRLNTLLQFAIDFFLPDIGPQKYIVGEVMVRVENQFDMERIQKSLGRVETDIRLGMQSYYQASRILEIKGLSTDEKTALIQENLLSLIKHRPQDFDYDILSDMQHFLVLSKEEFTQVRAWRHISRIICIHYLFRKSLRFSLEVYPERRYINVKIIRAHLYDRRPVVGVVLGMSFIRDHEKFGAPHIMNSIRALLPAVHKVEGSFFCYHSRIDSIVSIYLEIERGDDIPITLEETRLLKERLGVECENRIELQVNPIFMPQNEEMLLRHILILSGELRYARDLPQVMIDFAQQIEEKLEFLVVVLRVANPQRKSIIEQFEIEPTLLECLPDRMKMLAWPRKKYQKEASIFRVRIHKEPFLRKDYSVDLNQARQMVAKELVKVIGEFRDYNGGIIAKENELFEKLRKYAHEHPSLLENIFYSLQPPIMRSVLPKEPLKKIYDMFEEGEREEIPPNLPYQIRMQYEEKYFYILVICRDALFRDSLLTMLQPYGGKIATCFHQQAEDLCYFGLIVCHPEEEEALKLRLALEQKMAEFYSIRCL